jgi:hypothetical protein
MPEICHNCFRYHPVDHAMAQSVICRPLTIEDWVQYQASPCRTCDGKLVLGQVFLQELRSPPINIITPMLCTHSPICDGLYICLPQQLWVSLSTRLNITLPSKTFLPALGLTSLLFSGYRRSSPGVQRHRHAVNHSFPPSVGVKNKCKYTSALYIDLHGVHGENCTFCSTLQSMQIVNKGSNNKIHQNYSFLTYRGHLFFLQR